MPLAPGTRLGPYEILAPIGAGGMGEVYRATDTRLHRDVAIKFSNERFSDRVAQEARAVAALNHPNICTLHDVGSDHLVMEFIEGPTLAERLLEGAIPLDEALGIALQIAEAFEAAHDNGIVHRDLKPANVKIKPDGAVKVLDFGLAKTGKAPSVASTDSPTIALTATQPGVIMGTAAYMSPEQAAGKPVDKRADIWSFGVLLFEMLTGKPLFSGETAAHTLADVLRGDIELSKLPKATPDAIRRLIERCLDRDVRTRLRDIGEARVAIRRYLANPSALAIGTTRPAKVPWAITAIAAVSAVVLGYVAYRHSREEPPRVTRLYLPAPEKGVLVRDIGVAVSVSPDGRHIAYSAIVEGTSGVYLRDLSSATVQLLATGARHPFWSPDSRFIGFFLQNKLMKIAVNGGTAQAVCDVVSSPGGGSWGSDNTILFSHAGGGIFRVPAMGGAPVQVTELDATQNEDSHRYPWLLPDGRHFLYTARTAQRTTSAIYVGDVTSKDRKQLAKIASNAIYAEPGYILFIRNRTLMVQPFNTAKLETTGGAVPAAEQLSYDMSNVAGNFAASQTGVLAYTSDAGGGRLQLTWFDRTGKAVGKVGPVGDIEMISLSPDGTSVVAVRNDPQTGNFDLWQHNLTRGTDSRLTFTGSNRFPVWSPDGTRIAFDGARDGSRKLYVMAANGTGQQEILDPANRLPVSWSRDGRYLMTMTPISNPKTGNDIWVLPLFGERKSFPYVMTEFFEGAPKLSPDGRWLAYQSTESGRSQIYVVSFPTPGGKWQISADGGERPFWSRDGNELFFITRDKMMAVEVKTGGTFQAGVPKPLFDVQIGGRNTTFEVSNDGKFLIPVGAEQSSVPMTVILNWPEILKK